jgi:hypothetical protein
LDTVCCIKKEKPREKLRGFLLQISINIEQASSLAEYNKNSWHNHPREHIEGVLQCA